MIDREGYLHLHEGLRLHYRVIGDGQKAVVIPVKSSLAPDMETLAGRRKLIFYDQRSRGQSDVDADESAIWIDYEVQDIEAVRQHFELDRFSLIGWSYMGAMVALYAAVYTTYVERLILMCPIPPWSDAPYNDAEVRAKKVHERTDPDAVQRLEEMQKQGLETSDPERYCREHSKVYLPRQMGNPQALTRMRSEPCAFSNEWPINKTKNFPPVVTEWDWRVDVTSIRSPTLVIHGEEDLNPEEAAREWAGHIPQARVLTIPGCGHFPHIEAPEIFFSAVDQFLHGEWPEGSEEVSEVAP